MKRIKLFGCLIEGNFAEISRMTLQTRESTFLSFRSLTLIDPGNTSMKSLWRIIKIIIILKHLPLNEFESQNGRDFLITLSGSHSEVEYLNEKKH